MLSGRLLGELDVDEEDEGNEQDEMGDGECITLLLLLLLLLLNKWELLFMLLFGVTARIYDVFGEGTDTFMHILLLIVPFGLFELATSLMLWLEGCNKFSWLVFK